MKAETRPETLAFALKSRLRGHALWDLSLSFVPPLLALLGAAYLLVLSGWISPTSATVLALLAGAIVAVFVWRFYRQRAPELQQAARLVDQRADAKDHFLTLVTLDPAQCQEPLLTRLRSDAAGLASRVELKRDFPYRVKPSTYWSVGSSLTFTLLLYYLILPSGASVRSIPDTQRLRQLAQKMATTASLKELAAQLKTLAAKLENEKITPEEKQAALQETSQKVAEEEKKQPDKDDRDLLSQAADELKGTEPQHLANGKQEQEQLSNGGGNLQSNLPKEGTGENKQSQGNGGDGQGQTAAQTNKDMRQGKTTGNKDPGQEKDPRQQGDAKGNQPDPNRPGKDPTKDRADKGQGGSKEGSGKNEASEEPPQSAPPAERFYRAGEGKEGLKGARYVTVRLPEEIATDGKGDNKATKDGTGNRRRTAVPLSNVPLPPHLPNATAEKQPMPLEYRDIIR